LAGLLTYSFFERPSRRKIKRLSIFAAQFFNFPVVLGITQRLLVELTAARSVQDFHLIPFSPLIRIADL
jgi:hypothetical protein